MPAGLSAAAVSAASRSLSHQVTCAGRDAVTSEANVIEELSRHGVGLCPRGLDGASARAQLAWLTGCAVAVDLQSVLW